MAIARKHPEIEYGYVTAGTPLPMRTPGVDQSNIYFKMTPRNKRTMSEAISGWV